MAYQALYRQWRPQSFSDFVGQEAIVTTLKNQIMQGRIAHAYLFCGSRGTGKTTAAKLLAHAINCQSPVDGDACGVCDACVQLKDENTLDIVEIDAASNNGVDDIRDLRDKVKYPPQAGKYRVYIIDEVHMLSTGAFNALLKTLEEPPAHVVFILATTEPQKLPATILSRCQRYDFQRFPLSQLVSRLRQVTEGMGAKADEAALTRIARAAEGGMRDALSILDMCLSYAQDVLDEPLVLKVLGVSDRAFLSSLAQALIDSDTGAALKLIDEGIRRGHEVQVLTRDITGTLRDLLLAQTLRGEAGELMDLTQEDAAQLRAQADQASQGRLLRMLDLFLEAETDLKWAAQPRVALEMAVVRACMPEESRTLEALVERVEQLEKRIREGGAAAVPPAQQNGPQAAPKAGRKGAEVAVAPPAEKQVEDSLPVPVSPPEGAAPQRSADAVWEDLNKLLKTRAPALMGAVLNGRFAGREGTAYTLAFAKPSEIYYKLLMKEDKQAQLQKLLEEAAQGPAQVRIVMEGEALKDPGEAAQQRLEQVFDLFGRENVQVVDDEG